MTTKDRYEQINFCPCCFASSDGGSGGCNVMDGHCLNCGAGSSEAIKLPRWAIEEIRKNASWVGKRYYPSEEDKTHDNELKQLRSLLPNKLPGRTATKSGYGWHVVQLLHNGNVSTYVQADTEEEALEKAKTLLPFAAMNNLASEPEVKKIVCKRCNDSHKMWHDGLESIVMCTSCPVPCQKCRFEGKGAFCAQTPCKCSCH